MDVVGGVVVERLDDDWVCAEREQDGAEDTATNRLGNTDLLSTIPRSFPDLARITTHGGRQNSPGTDFN